MTNVVENWSHLTRVEQTEEGWAVLYCQSADAGLKVEATSFLIENLLIQPCLERKVVKGILEVSQKEEEGIFVVECRGYCADDEWPLGGQRPTHMTALLSLPLLSPIDWSACPFTPACCSAFHLASFPLFLGPLCSAFVLGRDGLLMKLNLKKERVTINCTGDKWIDLKGANRREANKRRGFSCGFLKNSKPQSLPWFVGLMRKLMYNAD